MQPVGPSTLQGEARPSHREEKAKASPKSLCNFRRLGVVGHVGDGEASSTARVHR